MDPLIASHESASLPPDARIFILEFHARQELIHGQDLKNVRQTRHR
jgi:hypothetical protein